MPVTKASSSFNIKPKFTGNNLGINFDEINGMDCREQSEKLR